jgi:hypothetical protein
VGGEEAFSGDDMSVGLKPLFGPLNCWRNMVPFYALNLKGGCLSSINAAGSTMRFRRRRAFLPGNVDASS